MGLKRTDDFCADAVWIALTSGLTHKQVASDLGACMSTLTKWITAQFALGKQQFAAFGALSGLLC